jgi:hypothetical protein
VGVCGGGAPDPNPDQTRSPSPNQSPTGRGSPSPSPRKSPIGFGPKSPSPRESPIGFGPKSPSPRRSPIFVYPRVRASPRKSPIPLDLRARINGCALEGLKLKSPGKLLPLDADASAVHSRPADRGKISCRGSSPLLCAPALRGPRISSATWYRLGGLLRGTTCPRLCTPSACTSQVLVCHARGTSYWGHPLGEPNAPPAPMQLPRLRDPSRSHYLPWRHTYLLCTFACAPSW